MSTPFLGTLGKHPTGITNATFREEEICGICRETGTSGVIPEICTAFSTTNILTRINQEAGRIFSCLRPNPHGQQTRHIFHKTCLEQWFERNPTCPTCRGEINSSAMLTTAQKLRNEMRRHPNIWGAFGAVATGALACWTGLHFGMARKSVKLLEYGTAFITFLTLRERLRR